MMSVEVQTHSTNFIDNKSDLKEPDRHPVHFYEDGNIIFVAGNTSFKLYRGLLAHHSQFMDDMFAMPQPKDVAVSSALAHYQTGTQTVVDTTPVVHLQESAEEFEAFLNFVLFPKQGKQSSFVSSLTPEELLSIVRISRKYLFDDCYEQAIQYLAPIMPATFEEYLKMDAPNQNFRFWVDILNDPALLKYRPMAFYRMATGVPKPTNSSSPSGLSIEDSYELVQCTISLQRWIYETIQVILGDQSCPKRYCPFNSLTGQPLVALLIAEECRSDPIKYFANLKSQAFLCPGCRNSVIATGVDRAQDFFKLVQLQFGRFASVAVDERDL